MVWLICTLGSLCCKIALCVSVNVLWLFRRGDVVEIKQKALSFSWQEEIGFHAKNERFIGVLVLLWRQNLKYDNFASSFERPCQKLASKSVLHMQHDYFSSFKQSNCLFLAMYCHCCHHFLKSLLTNFLCCWGVSKLWQAWEDVKLGFGSRRLLDVGSFVLSYFTQE